MPAPGRQDRRAQGRITIVPTVVARSQWQELAGPEVVMAHRLLKSGAEDVVGHGAYALISAAAVTRFDIPTDAANPLVETYEYYSPIHAFVFPLQQG